VEGVRIFTVIEEGCRPAGPPRAPLR